MVDNIMKWKISIFSMILFLIVTHNATYTLSNNLFENMLGKTIDENGKITNIGYILHALVFILLVRYSMDLNLFS
jgi:hypothetical protein